MAVLLFVYRGTQKNLLLMQRVPGAPVFLLSRRTPPRGLSVSDQGEETVQYHAVRGRSARSFFAQARIWKFAVGAACGPR